MVGIFIAFMVLRYLNRKALGMQTILDQMINDRIYLVISIWATDIMVIISIEFMTPLNPYQCNYSLTITFLNRVCRIAGIWQFSAILVIRYLLVFYQKLMNSVDENLVKRIARSFVTFTSIFFILISDLESTGIYQLMSITTGKFQKYGFNELFIIAAIICLIILIVTQYHIEMFRKSVDLRGRLHQLEVWHYEGEENQECNNESNKYYKMNTNRIILCLSLVVLVLVIGVGSKVIVRITGDLYNGWLQFTTVLHFILTIVIPMIFIIRNDNLYNLFKCQIIKFFELCQK